MKAPFLHGIPSSNAPKHRGFTFLFLIVPIHHIIKFFLSNSSSQLPTIQTGECSLRCNLKNNVNDILQCLQTALLTTDQPCPSWSPGVTPSLSSWVPLLPIRNSIKRIELSFIILTSGNTHTPCIKFTHLCSGSLDTRTLTTPTLVLLSELH